MISLVTNDLVIVFGLFLGIELHGFPDLRGGIGKPLDLIRVRQTIEVPHLDMF